VQYSVNYINICPEISGFEFNWKITLQKIPELCNILLKTDIIWVHLQIFLFNLLKPTGYVMHHQFNIQQL
jgi:hypothetical protein